MYMKFQKLVMTGYKDMDKNIKNGPKRFFSLIGDPHDFFFKNRALSVLYPYGALISCKKLVKTNGRPLRYLKTDKRNNGRTDGWTRAITKDPLV